MVVVVVLVVVMGHEMEGEGDEAVDGGSYDPTKPNCTFKPKPNPKPKSIKRPNNKKYDEEDSNGPPNRWTQI